MVGFERKAVHCPGYAKCLSSDTNIVLIILHTYKHALVLVHSLTDLLRCPVATARKIIDPFKDHMSCMRPNWLDIFQDIGKIDTGPQRSRY